MIQPPPAGSASPGGAPIAGPPQGAAVTRATTPQGVNPPPEMERQIVVLSAKAKQIVYSEPENFENMMAMFERAGEEGFPQAASTVVNTVLDQVEQSEGEQQPDILAAAGAILLGSISEDLTVGGAMQITPDLFNKAAAKSITDWMQNHPERVDGQGTMAEMAQMQGKGDQPAPGPAPPGPPESFLGARQ